MLLQRFDRLPYPNLESELSGESLQQLVGELLFGRTSCMLEPVSVNAAGAGSGWHGRYPPGRKAICIPERRRLEEHGGMGARPKGGRFLHAVEPLSAR